MKNDRKFYYCERCGNLVGMVESSGVKVVCCGSPMIELEPNTTDAAQEKHVPVIASRNGDKLTVAIGSVPHPMTDEHHITWIALAQSNRTTRVMLPSTGESEAEFYLEGGEEAPVTAYAYCNLHGLWAADL